MYNKTTDFKQTSTYDIVEQSEIVGGYTHVEYTSLNKSTSVLMHFNQTVYVSSRYGIVSLIITDNPTNQLEQYILHGMVAIHPGMYFYLLKITDDASVDLYHSPNDVAGYHHSNYPLMIQEVKETIFLPQVYASYYQIKKAPYYFDFEKHYYWEFTIVNSGTLQTNIDGKNYTLNKNDCIFYGPFQKHNQQVAQDMCTYVTIMFDIFPINKALLNKVFTLNQRQIRLMEQIVRYSENDTEQHVNDLFINQLKELIILLLHNNVSETPSSPRTTTMRFNFENDLLNSILEYIHQNIYGALRVIDLCDEFAISRATIQSLFKNNLMITPKQYLSTLRLKEAKILINESKLTLSEIANQLGYSSIHYFSRAFKEHFEMTPSEYAKSLVKK